MVEQLYPNVSVGASQKTSLDYSSRDTEILASNMNNTYVTSLKKALPRRSFLAIVGCTGFLVAACGKVAQKPEISPQELGVQAIIAEKTRFISAVNTFAASNPIYAPALQVVVEHNALHIAALTKFAPISAPEASASAMPELRLSLPILSAQCAAFSNSHLEFACSGIGSELSRTLGLIAGSEITHHAFLNAITT